MDEKSSRSNHKEDDHHPNDDGGKPKHSKPETKEITNKTKRTS